MNTELGRVLLQYVALHGVCKYVSQAHLLYTVAPAPQLHGAPQSSPGSITQSSSPAQRWPLCGLESLSVTVPLWSARQR